MKDTYKYIVYLGNDNKEIDYAFSFLITYYQTVELEYMRYEKDGLTFWRKEEIKEKTTIVSLLNYAPIDEMILRYSNIGETWLKLETVYKHIREIWDLSKIDENYVLIFSNRLIKITKKNNLSSYELANYINIPSVKELLFSSKDYIEKEISEYINSGSIHETNFMLKQTKTDGEFKQKMDDLVNKVKQIFPNIKKVKEINANLPIITVNNVGESYTFKEGIIYWYHHNHRRGNELRRFLYTESDFLADLKNEKDRWKL
jgi:hypothetical protein